jgi:glycosyltransferase involved in cell wall biosynthesis
VFRNNFVAVVVPAHNERRHIAQVIESTPRFVDLLVIVDDGSTDGSSDVVRGITDARLHLLQHAQNRGVGAAIVTGYRFALEQGADVVGVMGGDGQMDTAHLPSLLDPVVDGRCDFTKGNRFFSWRSWRGMPLPRAIGNVGLSLLTKVASGYWHIFDAQNGYTVISAAMLTRLPLDRLETGYQFENRLLIHLNACGARIQDVGIPARYGNEESGIKLWRDVPAILWTLLTGFWTRIRQKYLTKRLSLPGMFFLSGVFLLTLGIVVAISGRVMDKPSWLPQVAVVCIVLGSACLGSFLALDLFNGRGLKSRPQPSVDLTDAVRVDSGSQVSRTGSGH